MRIIFVSVFVLLLVRLNSAFSQKVRFNRVVQNKTGSVNAILGIAQDKQGYLWIANSNKGLQRYNGSELKVYENDPLNNNSLANNFAASVSVDSNNIVWIGTVGAGLDRYDPSKNTFTHFRHDPNDGSSLSNDTVYYVLADHSDNIWAGTATGLDMLDIKTGKFIHYIKKGDNALNTKTNFINTIYEDRQGVLWIGSIISFTNGAPDKGFLSRLDKKTGKITYFMHDSTKANSITGKFVRSILEDSKGNFWIGTGGDGLHIMDRDKGIFTHYYYDSLHPEKLSPPPVCGDCSFDAISFISEDALGTIWIGSLHNGINQYDPVSKK